MFVDGGSLLCIWQFFQIPLVCLTPRAWHIVLNTSDESAAQDLLTLFFFNQERMCALNLISMIVAFVVKQREYLVKVTAPGQSSLLQHLRSVVAVMSSTRQSRWTFGCDVWLSTLCFRSQVLSRRCFPTKNSELYCSSKDSHCKTNNVSGKHA